MRMLGRARYLPALCMVAALPLRAQYVRTGVSLPGLESDPAGTILPQSCSVKLTDGQISVELQSISTETAPALLLTTPLFGWSGPADPYPDRQFPELEIRVDGTLITPEGFFKAFAGGYDITASIVAAELDPWAITHNPPLIGVRPAHPVELKGLKNVRAIEDSGDGYVAKWRAQRVIRIPLKPGASARVELSYTARPSTSISTAEGLDTPAREASYCLSPRLLKQALRSESRELAIAEFAIQTGIDDKQPDSVMLDMTPGAGPAAAIFFCGPHGKPIAAKGSIKHQRAQVDAAGTLHVLSVLEAGKPHV